MFVEKVFFIIFRIDSENINSLALSMSIEGHYLLGKTLADIEVAKFIIDLCCGSLLIGIVTIIRVLCPACGLLLPKLPVDLD